jgi:hypothetical protein
MEEAFTTNTLSEYSEKNVVRLLVFVVIKVLNEKGALISLDKKEYSLYPKDVVVIGIEPAY